MSAAPFGADLGRAPRRLFHCERAWLGGPSPVADVLIDTAGDRITAVSPGAVAPPDASRLPGLTLPGLVNTHSHVFHRAIRGRTHTGTADFWQWRSAMYAVAERLDPDSLYTLARATYAEMAVSGVTSVGEFHYLHAGPAGRPYANPNAMGDAVIRAANDAGLRITLLDACYLQSDVGGSPLVGVQQRFGDGSWQAWVERVGQLAPPEELARIGVAIHSVRAVPRAALSPVAEYAHGHHLPLHVHVSEQPAENRASAETYGSTPTAVLAGEGVLGAMTTAIHATHLTGADIELLGASRTSISMCCTTERDLADGIGPAVRLTRAGSPLCVGSDSQAVIDLWEEGRAIELHERLRTGKRGHLHAEEIARVLTANGAASIGWDAGRIAVGALADLVTVRLDSPRTAGARADDLLAAALFSATSADVTTVVVGSRVIVDGGRHCLVPDVGESLTAAIAACFGQTANT